MNGQTHLLGLLAMQLLVYPMLAPAQQDQTTLATEAPAESTADAPADQEVEINEDNYRQFMELKDALQQRTVLPENSYQSQAGLEKLDRLPEESQKHLRNQLREIIVQGDPWQPGDEESDYPYVPSAMAANDPALKNQEAEAWGELVDNYHAREAEIYANSQRSNAASAAAGFPATGTGSSATAGAETSGGSTGQSVPGQQAGSQNSSRQADAADSYSPNAANNVNATSAEGVSQNAMEFLRKSRNITDNKINISANSLSNDHRDMGAEGKPSQTETQPGQASKQFSAQPQANQPQDAQQQASRDQASQQRNTDTPPAMSATQVKSTVDETTTESEEGVSQNALEYLTGESSGAEPVPADTLTIEELLNARGVDLEFGAGASGTDDDTQEDTPPDKGGAN